MFQLQYWNGAAAEWRGAGYQSSDYDAVVRALRDNQLMTGNSVSFRILMPATDHPMALYNA